MGHTMTHTSDDSYFHQLTQTTHKKGNKGIMGEEGNPRGRDSLKEEGRRANVCVGEFRGNPAGNLEAKGKRICFGSRVLEL